jgi:hypothetical protein
MKGTPSFRNNSRNALYDTCLLHDAQQPCDGGDAPSGAQYVL